MCVPCVRVMNVYVRLRVLHTSEHVSLSSFLAAYTACHTHICAAYARDSLPKELVLFGSSNTLLRTSMLVSHPNLPDRKLSCTYFILRGNETCFYRICRGYSC